MTIRTTASAVLSLSVLVGLASSVSAQTTLPPPPTSAPPADAEKTASGLAYKVLSPAKGKDNRPDRHGQRALHGWTTDGKMFDSSVKRGAAGEVPASAA